MRKNWLARQFAKRRDLIIGLTVSILLHVGLFSYKGCSFFQPPPEIYEPNPTLALMVMPELEPEQPDYDQVETLLPDLESGQDVSPPRQYDFPQYVTIDAFVQPIQIPQLKEGDIIAPAPMKIIPGGWGEGSGGQIFDPASLDQMAIPTLQLRPIFPEELRRNGVEGSALIEFIVTTEGKVRDALCLSETKPGFGVAAVNGVKKWQFRPGKKAGRAVNSRLRVEIIFDLENIEK